MDNDRDSMKDLWRQFRRLLVKKVGYFDLFREAARHELTPDWFQARYGSVWQHAFVLIKNLWLFLGVLAILNFFAPDPTLSRIRSHLPVVKYQDVDEAQSHLLLTERELNNVYLSRDSSLGPERSFLKSQSNHEWFDLEDANAPLFANFRNNRMVVSLVDPIFPEVGGRSFSEGSEEETEAALYPVDPFVFSERVPEASLIQLVELVRPTLNFQHETDGVEIFTFRAKSVFALSRAGNQKFVSPGFILGQVRRDLSRQAPKNWSIDSVEVELIPQRMAPYSWVLATLEGGYFFTPFTVPQSNYSSLLYGLDEEHDRLMLLDQPNAIIKKLLTVAFTVLSPLLLIVPIALLLWPIASKRGGRRLRDIATVAAHMMLALAAAFVVARELFDGLAPYLRESLAASLLLLLGSLLFFFAPLRFCSFQIPLQLAHSCGRKVKWSTKSWLFGYRRAGSITYCLCQLLGLGVWFSYLVVLFLSDFIITLFQISLRNS